MHDSGASANNLPQPDHDSATHSERVVAHIRGLIEQSGGSISFAEFMQAALYAPALGYYAAGSTKFGAAGDFVTAPEISPLFSRVVARQVAEVLRQFSDSSERQILELGAGSGVLVVDMLRALRELDCLPEQYFILEVSPDLAERQAAIINEQIPSDAHRVSWLSTLPVNFQGVVIANEVADALPVERFTITAGETSRLVVRDDAGRFVWDAISAPETLREAINNIQDDIGTKFLDGYCSEVSLALAGWISSLADSLQCGAIFLFDYGLSRREYYAPDRVDGWLHCFYRHHVHGDPLIYAGIQDLTAWVDFTAVAEAALDHGLTLAAYLTQSQFLLYGGLQEELLQASDLPTAAQIELSRAVKVLTMPGEMGESVKCMVLTKGDVVLADSILAADRAASL